MKRALLLVDIQNDFCPGGALAVPDGDQVVAVANRLLPFFPVVVATKDWHPRDHVSFASRHGRPELTTINTPYGPQVMWPDHCVQGSSGAEFHPQLHANDIDHVVYKGRDRDIDSYSAFFDNARQQETDLHAYLREAGITDLYLCGLATDYCVLFSGLDALELGYFTTIVEDGCRGVEVHPGDCARALASIVDGGGRRTTSEELLHELAGESRP